VAPKVKKQARKQAKPARSARSKPGKTLKAKAPRTAAKGKKPAKAKTKAAKPAAASSKPVAGTKAAAATEPSVPLILLVEDFADAREMYAEYFRFVGHRVETAENGLEAIDKATRFLPDVILMDLSLPVLDGWEATRRLKSDDRTRRIPIIALTGNALQGHEERAMRAGCDSFLAKPCLPEMVEQEINKFLALPAKVA
jgi:two-component system, cell cycle response regulator DivK